MAYLKRLLGAALLGFIVWVLYLTFPEWSSIFASAPATFSAENWQGAHKYRREAMARDILERSLYVGMRREDVLKLLGKPEQQSDRALHYFVALTAADYMVLTFEIDEGGRVAKAYLRQS
ncbi:MAG: hypothetical protein ROZ00_06810 [Denitratisoma sp.]|nr:hypothetical protein [Denitratisoma sp.]